MSCRVCNEFDEYAESSTVNQIAVYMMTPGGTPSCMLYKCWPDRRWTSSLVKLYSTTLCELCLVISWELTSRWSRWNGQGFLLGKDWFRFPDWSNNGGNNERLGVTLTRCCLVNATVLHLSTIYIVHVSLLAQDKVSWPTCALIPVLLSPCKDPFKRSLQEHLTGNQTEKNV